MKSYGIKINVMMIIFMFFWSVKVQISVQTQRKGPN